MPNLEGIDISSNQHGHGIDWNQVATHKLTFIGIKATGENGYVNPYFAEDRAQAHRIGIPIVAPYHFFDNRDPVVQAEQYLSVVGEFQTGEIPALDTEAAASEGIPMYPPERVLPWFQKVEKTTGIIPLRYMSYYYEQAGDPRYAKYPLWLPAYVNPPPTTHGPYLIWQFSQTSQISGISSFVDGNEIPNELALFAAAKHDTPPLPPPPIPENPMSVAINADGRAEYFDVDGGKVHHWWQKNAGWWTGPGQDTIHGVFDNPKGKTAKDVSAYAEVGGPSGDGHLSIIAKFTDGSRFRAYQKPQGQGGGWTDWVPFG